MTGLQAGDSSWDNACKSTALWPAAVKVEPCITLHASDISALGHLIQTTKKMAFGVAKGLTEASWQEKRASRCSRLQHIALYGIATSAGLTVCCSQV